MAHRPHRHSSLACLALCAALALFGCNRSADNPLEAAKVAIQAQDRTTAAVHLKNAMAQDPKSGEVRVLLGETLLQLGDPAGAVIELQRARDLKSPDDKVIPLLARAMLETGADKLVLEQFGATRLGSPEAQALLAVTLSDTYLVQKRPGKAREYIEAALKVAPSSGPARLALARIEASEGQRPKALALVNTLLEEQPKFDDGWAFKGVMHDAAQETDQALAAYARALEINPRQAEALYSMALIRMVKGDLKGASELQARMAKAWPRNPNSLYLEARINHMQGKHALARGQFAALLNVAPESVRTLIASGANELSLGAPIQAEAQLARAVSLAPKEAISRLLLAQAQLRLGRPDKATASVEPLLQSPKVSAAVLVVAAQARLLQGDALGSETLFARAAKLKPDDVGVRTAIASARMATEQDSDAALRELQQIAQSTSATDADMRVISARLARREGAEALKAIEKLEQKQPPNAMSAELRGQAALALNDSAGARKAFEDALRLDRLYVPALGQLTALDMTEGKPEQAQKRLTAALAVDKDNGQLLLMQASVLAKGAGTSAEVLDLLERATKADALNVNAWMALLTRHFRAGDFEAAILTAQSATKAIPDNLAIMDLTGRIQLAAGNANQASSTFADMMRIAPRSAAGYMGLGTVLLARGDIEAATKVVRNLVAQQPDSIDAQRMLGDLAVRAKRYDEASRIAKELRKRHPKSSAAAQLEARSAISQGKSADAVRPLREATTLSDPGQSPVLLHSVLTELRETRAASEFVEQWMRQHPKDALFLAHVGDTALVVKDLDQAASYYQRALAVEPTNVAALNNLATVLLQKGDPKAIEYARRALAIQPMRPEVLDTLAEIHAARNEFPQAIDALRKAVSRATAAAPLRITLAKVLVRSGDRAGAMAELQEVVKLGRANPSYEPARKLLNELRAAR